MTFFIETEKQTSKQNPEGLTEHKRAQMAKAILRQKNDAGGIPKPVLKL